MSDDATLEATGAALDALFVLVKTVATYRPDHPTSVQAAEAFTRRVDQAQPPFAVQLVAGVAFRDLELVPLDPERYQRVRSLATAMGRFGVQELGVTAPLTAPAAATIGTALALALAGKAGGMPPDAEGVAWRAIPQITWGVDSEEADPEVFIAAQLALAVGEAEALGGGETAWDWSAGLSVARRVVRSLTTDAAIAVRTIETMPTAWTIPRRAVSAALWSALALHHVGAQDTLARATGHATLALALSGFTPRGGGDVRVIAEATLPRLAGAPVRARTGVDPHRLRVTTVVQSIAHGPNLRDAWPSPVDLVELVYGLERDRCPPDLRVDLDRLDLLARAARAPGRDPRWFRALASASGVVPPGSRVRLADGRVGIVTGPGTAPNRPEVLLDGRRVVPEGAVGLLSGARR